MKSNRYKIMAIFLGTLMPQTYILNSLAVSNNFNVRFNGFNSQLENNGDLIYADNVFQLLVSAEKYVYEYTTNKDISYLKKAVDAFCETTVLLPIEYDEILYGEENLYKVHTMIRDEIYNIADIDEQSSMIIYYAEHIFLGWRKNKDLTVFRDLFLKVELISLNTNTKAQDRLNYLEEVTKYFSKYPDVNPDSNEIPDLDNYPPEIDDEVLDSNDNNDNVGSNDQPSTIPNTGGSIDNNTDSIVSEVTSSFSEYITKNNACFEKITVYKDGVPISTTEVQVPKSDYVKCGIYTYVHSAPFENEVIIDKEYVYGNQNENSEYSIHFTTNKNVTNPHYFNTGIRADANNQSVTYNQLKDAIYQLGIKVEGFSVTGNNKFLSVIDGKPMVLNKSVETYSKVAVERLFESYDNIDLKILKPADSNANTLENYLSDEEIKSFVLNGETVDLDNPFLFIENQVYVPVEDLMSKLDIKLSLSGDNITLTKGSTIVKLKVNSKSYSINNKEFIFSSSPMIHNSIIYSSIDTILREFNYELIWDDDSSMLSISEI